jgi:hypothetical protein
VAQVLVLPAQVARPARLRLIQGPDPLHLGQVLRPIAHGGEADLQVGQSLAEGFQLALPAGGLASGTSGARRRGAGGGLGMGVHERVYLTS